MQDVKSSNFQVSPKNSTSKQNLKLKWISLSSHIFLFIGGIIIFIATIWAKPADELLFLQTELKNLFLTYAGLLTFGVFTVLLALCGIAADWTKLLTNHTYQILFICLLIYEMLIIGSFMTIQKISTLNATAHILSLVGAHRFSVMRNSSALGHSSLGNLNDIKKHLIWFHTYFECCSGLKRSSNFDKPEFLNTVCCKEGVSIPCTAKNGFSDICDKKFLHYVWKTYWYFSLIANMIVLFQSIILGITIILYRLNRQKNVDKKKN